MELPMDRPPTLTGAADRRPASRAGASVHRDDRTVRLPSVGFASALRSNHNSAHDPKSPPRFGKRVSATLLATVRLGDCVAGLGGNRVLPGPAYEVGPPTGNRRIT